MLVCDTCGQKAGVAERCAACREDEARILEYLKRGGDNALARVQHLVAETEARRVEKRKEREERRLRADAERKALQAKGWMP